MSDVTIQEYATIETFIPQEFHFCRRFYITSSFFAVMGIGLLFVGWVPLIFMFFSDGFLNGPVARATIYLTATFLSVVALHRIVKREIDRVRFIVMREGIARIESYRETLVKWSEITGIRCRRIPLGKGLVEITAPHRRLILPSTITNFAGLGEALRQGLATAGKAALCNDVFFRTMAVMGTVNERWNERAKAAFWPLVIATSGFVLFNSFVASRVWGVGTISVILWAGIGLPLPLLVYAIADIRCNRRLEKALLDSSGYDAARDLTGELIIGILITAPFYGIIGIIARTILHT
jgi:hypothetical protein